MLPVSLAKIVHPMIPAIDLRSSDHHLSTVMVLCTQYVAVLVEFQYLMLLPLLACDSSIVVK